MTQTNRPEVEAAISPLILNRRPGNLLALSLAAYRDGDVDTAFDLFLTGMEGVVADQETATAQADFGALIEAALLEARNRSDATSLNTLATTPLDESEDDEFDLSNLADDDLVNDDEEEISEATLEPWRANLLSL